MRRGTTPTITCSIKGADLTGSKVYATIKQGEVEIDIEDPTIESTETGCTVTIHLTQAQTLTLRSGRANIQLRWIDANNTALATTVASLTVHKILKEGEITYE